MILVGSQRGGSSQLAAHLMNDRDNDHVTLEELRGFVADDLRGAMVEAHAVSKGTRCKQFLFSLSLNPPKGAEASIETFRDAADRAEATLGLSGQPRAIVIHEKEGRRHGHVVWSRIDPAEMKAVNLPHFKNRLCSLSKELYLEHGWELPEGHKTNGWKNPLNFTLAEWQQASRLDLDPREIKQVFHSAYERSDGQRGFKHALEEHGYFLAKGDRRGFVAVDMQGEVFAIARWLGVKTKDLAARLGTPDALPSVDAVRGLVSTRLSDRVRGVIREDREAKAEELRPLAEELKAMVTDHRAERDQLVNKQAKRWQAETKERAARLHKGVRGVWELLTGKATAIRNQNEREAFDGYLRDRSQREALFRAQMKERAALQRRIEEVRKRQRQERMRLARRMVEVLRRSGQDERERISRTRPRGLDMER